MFPTVTRPTFAPGYVDAPCRLLTWDHAVQRLTDAKEISFQDYGTTEITVA